MTPHRPDASLPRRREMDLLACGLMAQRRDVFCRRTALAVPLVVLGLLLLAGSVFVSNCVVACRLKVARLDDRREFLAARTARLQTRLNTLTSPAVIRARAVAELGLRDPERPNLVLVQTPARTKARTGLFARVLAGLGGGEPVEAATDPLVGKDSGSMVSLLPRAASAAETGPAGRP